MGTEECAALAEPVVKKVVDMLANRDYKNLPSAAVLRGPLTPALVKGLLEGHLEGCGLRAADPYGTPMLPGQMNGSQLDIIPLPGRQRLPRRLRIDFVRREGQRPDAANVV